MNISSYISSIDSVTKADADDTLGSVLPLVQSSHSPLLIFTKDSEFLGIVSPYQTIYSSKYPYTTKLSSIVFVPPQMTEDTQLYEVASHMLESRVYTLPIFGEDKKLVGVIDSKNIFQGLIKDQDTLALISSTIELHKPVTASSSATVGEISQLMKDQHVSRVILVDDNGILSSIVSRIDLHNAFMQPADKQRFGKNGMQQTDRAFDKEKVYRRDEKAKNYATELVYTLPRETKQEEIIKQLLSSEHNSVVIIDKYRKPVGFVSMHDILVGVASLRPKETINLIMSKPTSNVSEAEIAEVEESLTRFGEKINKRIPIDKIEVSFEEPMTQDGGSIIFNTLIMVNPVSGAKIVSTTKDRSIVDAIHAGIAQIDKQLRRNDS